MSAEDLADFQAFKAAQAASKAKEERKQNLNTFNQMIDEQVNLAIPELRSLAEELATVKQTIFSNFKTLLDMKADVLKMTKDGQRSHTFVSDDKLKRVILGYYNIDHYKDTAEDGIAMIKAYISGLATSPETKELVDMVLKLLSKDQSGNLKASRVLALRALADKSDSQQFKEGVEMIMDAYDPIPSKQYIRADVRDTPTSAWQSIPLSITDARIALTPDTSTI